MSMTVDFRDFEKNFKKLTEDAVPSEVGKGIFKAGSQLLIDAMEKIPYAPFDKGHLWGSAGAEGSGSFQKIKETNAESFKAEISADSISSKFGFTMPYAARWHEISEDKRINWTLPGSGRKYLESKMIRYMRKYMENVALHLRNLLK